jgi:DNA-binding NarL/FixJ family response regulator
MPIRILLIEDYEPFRRFVRSTLRKRPELKIVGEVSDGFEGVQKAKELKPDLILLDIGLPTLDGFEVARRIRKLVPESRIVFLSMEDSADLVQEALSLGARGYLEKARSVGEILAAVEAVCQGKQYVSGGLLGLQGQGRT